MREFEGSFLLFRALGEVEPPIHERSAAAHSLWCEQIVREAYCHVFLVFWSRHSGAVIWQRIRINLSRKTRCRIYRRALNGIEIYGDGNATRDYIYTRDLAKAIFNSATCDGVGGEVFQIATNRETTVQELAENLMQVLANAGRRYRVFR